MLLPPKNDKNRKEKKSIKANVLNNNKLQTLLIIRVFASNLAVGHFHANYERCFVKKIFNIYSSICSEIDADRATSEQGGLHADYADGKASEDS